MFSTFFSFIRPSPSSSVHTYDALFKNRIKIYAYSTEDKIISIERKRGERGRGRGLARLGDRGGKGVEGEGGGGGTRLRAKGSEEEDTLT